MKICIINNLYPPYDRGGAEQVVIKTVEGLLTEGHQIAVITAAPHQEEVERRDNLTIYRIHSPNLFFYTESFQHNFVMRFFWHLIDTFNFAAANKVKTILEAEKPNAVHTHNLMGLSFLIPRVVKKLGLRHIHTVHDVQLVEPSGMILKEKEFSWRYTGLPTKIYAFFIKKLFGSPEIVISPSQFLHQFYHERHFFPYSHYEIVRNPLTFNYLVNRIARHGFELNLLYVGQIERHKGVLVLLEAFQNFSGKHPHSHLHIVGSGSLLSEIKKKYGDSSTITFYGRLERKKIFELFGAVDLTVVPSLCYENSPTVIFESFYAGVPVVASNIEGIAELIKEGENGLMFAAGDSHDLHSKIEWAEANRNLLAAMGTNALASLKNYSQEKYISQLETLYRA